MRDVLLDLRWIPVVLLWSASVWFGTVILTPLSWGMAWSDYSLAKQVQIICLAVLPLIVIIAAYALWIVRGRPRRFPAMTLLLAPAADLLFLFYSRLSGH
ncbi:hypothetical protein IP78_11505 [Brevundimonas sp. AAP58]|uniref:hypothetical protein n=1 Tax=Brevundimonas sp. AAP58 TaxID=1523422 RepID=UPI0006B8EABC|nr:hypothetical protein [Brevundimonas sp. AAP58]KPF78045.1 hypothetical protein IP78_11505 [Brevundimonas sp. AAP58]